MKPPADDPRKKLLGQLHGLFRRKGYDGVSIGDISAETGLGRSSLYHYFPGGKAQMAQDVLTFARTAMEAGFFAPLKQADAPLVDRLDRMLAAVDVAYKSGEEPCILASLLGSSDDGPLSDGLARLFEDWVTTIADSLAREGSKPAEARTRAIAALASIQGGLVLARGLKDRSVFADALAAARKLLLAP